MELKSGPPYPLLRLQLEGIILFPSVSQDPHSRNSDRNTGPGSSSLLLTGFNPTLFRYRNAFPPPKLFVYRRSRLFVLL